MVRIIDDRVINYIGQVFKKIEPYDKLEVVIDKVTLSNQQQQGLAIADELKIQFENIANRIEQFVEELYGDLEVCEPKLRQQLTEQGKSTFIHSGNSTLQEDEKKSYQIEPVNARANSFCCYLRDNEMYSTLHLVSVTNTKTNQHYIGNEITAQLARDYYLFSRMDGDNNLYILTPNSIKEFHKHFMQK